MAERARDIEPLEPLLSIKDVARILGVGRSTVYSLIKKGELTPVELNIQKVRFRARDIRRYTGQEEEDG